jgi:MraZ protein
MGTVDYFERKLDEKRRLTIPPELRDAFASGAVITRGFGRYLHLYPKDVWRQLVEPKLAGDLLDERIADLNVQFRMGKSEMQLDGKQGRITLEQHQVKYAGISRDIVAINVGQYWRILAKETAEEL